MANLKGLNLVVTSYEAAVKIILPSSWLCTAGDGDYYGAVWRRVCEETAQAKVLHF